MTIPLCSAGHHHKTAAKSRKWEGKRKWRKRDAGHDGKPLSINQTDCGADTIRQRAYLFVPIFQLVLVFFKARVTISHCPPCPSLFHSLQSLTCLRSSAKEASADRGGESDEPKELLRGKLLSNRNSKWSEDRPDKTVLSLKANHCKQRDYH